MTFVPELEETLARKVKGIRRKEEIDQETVFQQLQRKLVEARKAKKEQRKKDRKSKGSTGSGVADEEHVDPKLALIFGEEAEEDGGGLEYNMRDITNKEKEKRKKKNKRKQRYRCFGLFRRIHL